MRIFVSYSSKDEEYARILDKALSLNGYDTWFAPKDIGGGENFVSCIGNELSNQTDVSIPEQRVLEDMKQVSSSEYYILLLSANSMKSTWVPNEFVYARNHQIPMKILQVDHSALTSDFEFMMNMTQITECYHMNPHALENVLSEIKNEIPSNHETKQGYIEREKLTYDQIGIYPIASGDPYYLEGNTLRINLGNSRFFLAPPEDCLQDPENSEYLNAHHFHRDDEVFGSDLRSLCDQVKVSGLYEMIEESRRKIFLQFRNKENGCYFNNEKYGVEKISGFERTEDLAERPVLRLEMFVTDYYTHRVMKDVCKQLSSTNKEFIRSIDYDHLGANKILFTSLGVNLILCEGKDKILLTSRSVNAAETYKRHSYSLSMIEGVSASDYDTFNQSVNVQYTVYRGLKEELGVEDSHVRKDTLKFYDLFVNPYNLEMGLSCSIELVDQYSLEKDIVPLHGKDEKLEVAEKKVLDIASVESYVNNNFAGILPQSIYVLCTFMESMGVFMIDRMHRKIFCDTKSVIAKNGTNSPCGDTYVWADHYIAVIDGATPKGDKLWNGLKGDVFVSHLVADSIVDMNPSFTAQEAICYINDVVRKAYDEFGVNFDDLQPAERLQCSLLIYSVKRHEVWSFGDCMLRINHHDFRNTKEGDALFAALRAFCIQIERDRIGNAVNEHDLSMYGREQILPYLKQYITLANRNVPFGYDVIDGGRINPENVKVYAVQKDDCVVMASDGYPRLFDTFEETEEYLLNALKKDPMCIGILRGTKGVQANDQNFDDRTYVSFRVS